MSVDGLPRAFASWKRGTREDAEVEAGCASTKSSGWRSGGWTYMHERERCVPSVESSDGIRTYKFPCFVRSQRPCRVGPVCLPGSLMGEEMKLIGHDRIEIATQRNWPIVTLHQSKRKLDGNTDESSTSAAQRRSSAAPGTTGFSKPVELTAERTSPQSTGAMVRIPSFSTAREAVSSMLIQSI